MPTIRIHKNGQIYEGEIPEDSNLVVLTGVRKFPFPHLRYGCGMGKCTKCKSRIIAGAEGLAEPNWKEMKLLTDEERAQGFRLACQLRVFQDLELTQDDARVNPETVRAAGVK